MTAAIVTLPPDQFASPGTYRAIVYFLPQLRAFDFNRLDLFAFDESGHAIAQDGPAPEQFALNRGTYAAPGYPVPVIVQDKILFLPGTVRAIPENET